MNQRRRVMGGGDDTYGYIILDQSQTDPTLKIVDMSGRTYATGYRTPRVIKTIRKMSHCYVGTPGGDVLYLKQLNDNDHTMYADGTSAVTDITQKNVFMRLPYFFTRATEITSASNLTPSSGSTIWMIEFFIDKKQTSASTVQPEENNWKQWGGNDLIGKYEAECSDTNNNKNGVLRSRSGATPTGSISQSNFKTKARNNGSGFTLVKWRHQNLMAVLFYAYYGHTNCQLLVGSGSHSATRTSGMKNSFGMTDTNSSNGNTDSIVFWGLENWWGNKTELVDNVTVNDTTWSITEDNGSTRTVSNTITTGGSWYYPTKFIMGDYLDVIGIQGSTKGSGSTGYCDGQLAYGTNRIVGRSCDWEYGFGGVAFAYVEQTGTVTNNDRGSRLAFIGNIEIV